MRYFLVCMLITACGSANSGKNPDASVQCDLAAHVAIDVNPGAVQTDGSVTLYGAVRFEPLVGDPNTDVERTVYAVYVADQEVQPAATDFNFRTWSVTLNADRLAAFTTTAMDGTKSAKLPVWAYLQGGCVVELPPGEEPVIPIPAGSGSGSGSGSGA